MHFNDRQVYVSDQTFSTNKYGCLLFDLVTMNAQNKTVTLAFGLLKKDEKKEQDYCWILNNYKRYVWGDTQLINEIVWVMDLELAFYNAVITTFGDRVLIILCSWHIMKDVTGHPRLRAKRSMRRVLLCSLTRLCRRYIA